ncbi:helix-turn-helix domain-containing protein [Alienimonas sp. DA493]|uniref:helix-turn-helix domain-containing protein n=1 Tax=Alienimonas sp. DA493 TaxID=3373605 RepID=UPI0037550F7E
MTEPEAPAKRTPRKKLPTLVEWIEELNLAKVKPRVPGRDRLLTTGEAAALMNVTPSMVRTLTENGELPFVVIGARNKIWWTDLRLFLDQRRYQG